jgi:hypothetical protein
MSSMSLPVRENIIISVIEHAGRPREEVAGATSTGNWRLDALTALADARAEVLHDCRR